MKMVWIICFCILVVTGSSLGIRCPINVNDSVNITRIVTGGGSTVWSRNNEPLTQAIYNASTGTCYSPSYSENYTIYCKAGGMFTLEVHHPVEGDIYRDLLQSNIITSIIFQEPETIRLVITPPLNTNITLFDDDTYNLTTTVTCTKPTPVLKWIVRAENGTDITINGDSTTDKTGCDVNQTTITSRMTISKQTVNLFYQPFQVLSQLSYNECDNIHTSLPGRYFNITDDRLGVGVGIGIGVGIGVCLVLVGVIVLIIWIILKRKGRQLFGFQSTGDGTRVNTGEDTHYAGLDNINMSTSATDADHSMNSQDYVNTPSPSVGLTPSTAQPQSSTYDSLDPSTTDEPSKTYEQLKIYQNLK